MLVLFECAAGYAIFKVFYIFMQTNRTVVIVRHTICKSTRVLFLLVMATKVPARYS